MSEINYERAPFYISKVHKVVPFVDSLDEMGFDEDVLGSLSEAADNLRQSPHLNETILASIELYSNFLVPDETDLFSYSCDIVILSLMAEAQGLPEEMIVEAIARTRTEIM